MLSTETLLSEPAWLRAAPTLGALIVYPTRQALGIATP